MQNWEIFHSCYFEEDCSFAHGCEELRCGTQKTGNKIKLCKSFKENGFCLFGKRCNYRHIIKEKRLFTYQYILQKTNKDLINELQKNENSENSVLKMYKMILLKRKVIM